MDYSLRSLLLDAIPSPDTNIARGLAALDKALRDKTTVHRAMYRDGLGWVDFVWGDEGKWPPNSQGRRKGERGIAHVLEARPRKDGLTGAQTRGLLRRMVRAIAEGDEVRRHEFGAHQRVIVGRDKTEVHLVKAPGSNAWALTVYDNDGRETQASLDSGYGGVDSGALGAASDASQPTHCGPTSRRPAVVAPSLAAGAIGPSLGRATHGTLQERQPEGAASGLTLDASGPDVNGDTFAEIERAAQESAFGHNCLPTPTPAQCKAGNYKVGRLMLHGLRIAIEQPRNTYREGVGADGKPWRNRMAAHYGYLVGTRGADGDGIDVFVGPHPEAEAAYVINQHVSGRFDEHKVMLAFASEDEARKAYLMSYDRGWKGLRSLVPVTLDQLKWWIRSGNKARALSSAELPTERKPAIMKKTFWNGVEPESQTLDALLYQIRRDDAGHGLMLDALGVADILEDADGVLALDALVVKRARMERTLELMRQSMARQAADTVKPLAVQISDPFLKNGVAHVAAVFELSDGQTISVFFHNPDVSPKKIGPTDDLISWKWMLNKKDITIVVAPERGRDLNIREVGARVMRLAAKNSAAFARANSKRNERMQRIDGMKSEAAALETELVGLQKRLEEAKVEKETRDAALERQLRALMDKQRAVFERVEKAEAADPVDLALVKALRDEYDDLSDEIRALRGEEKVGRTSWDTYAKLHPEVAASTASAAEVSDPAPMVSSDGEARAHSRKTISYFGRKYTLTNADDYDIDGADNVLSVFVTRKDGKTMQIGDWIGNFAYQSDPAALRALTSSGLLVVGGDDPVQWVWNERLGKLELVAVENTESDETSADGEPDAGAASAAEIPAPDSAITAEHAVAALVNDPFGEGESSYPAWEAPQEVVRALTEDQYRAIGERLEDENHHPENVVFYALRVGGPDDVAEARALMAAQIEAGGLTDELRARRKALHEKLRVAGIGEGDDDSTPIELSGGELGEFGEGDEGYAALFTAAFAHAEGLIGKSVFNPVLNADVTVRRSGVKKMVRPGSSRLKLKLVPAMLRLIAQGKRAAKSRISNDTRERNIKAYHYLKASARVGDQQANVYMVIKEDDKGGFLYEEFVNKNAMRGIAGVAPSLDGTGLDDPALSHGALENLAHDAEEVNQADDAALDATEVNVFNPGDKVVDQEGRNHTVMRQDDLRVYVREQSGKWFHPNHLILASGAKPKRVALDGLADALAEFDDMALDAVRGGPAYVMNLFIEGVDIDADGNPIGELAVEIGEEEDLTTEAGIARALQVAVARTVYDDRMANAEKYPDAEVSRVRDLAIADYQAYTAGAPRDMHAEIAKAIVGKDAVPLIKYFVHGYFSASEGVFERATGVKIRRMAAARKEETLKDWAGWSEDQKAEYAAANAQEEAERQAKREEERAARDRANLIAVLAHRKYRREDESIISAKDLIEERVSSGYVRLEEGKRGAAKKWTLWNDSTRRGMPLNKNEAEYAQMLLAGIAGSQPAGDAQPVAGVTDKAVVSANMATLRPFLSNSQKAVVSDGLNGEEAKFFAETMAELAETVKTMPRTYGQNGKGDQAIAYLHYFKGGMDWYVSELDMEGDGTEQAFGLADLGQGFPEVGYINLREVVQIGAELDFHWTPKTLAAIRGAEAPVEEQQSEGMPAGGPSIDKRDLLFRAVQSAAEMIGATLDPATVTGLLEIETVAVRDDGRVAVMISPHGYANFDDRQIELVPGEDTASLAARVTEAMKGAMDAHGNSAPDLTDQKPEDGMGEPVEGDSKSDDRALLQAVIDGKADLMDSVLPGKLEAIYTAHQSDAEMTDLWKRAINAYTAAMMEMAAGSLAA